MYRTLFTSLLLMSSGSWARYLLEDDYMLGDFFDRFSFWTAADPTHGFVIYQSEDESRSHGLIGRGAGGGASFGVDSMSKTPQGRPSVRLTSKKSYQFGLFILDVLHMPGGICGTWPAFWMVGPDWPNQGEIDIIEGVNDQWSNDMTLHTGPGCSVNDKSGFSGSLVSTNCASGVEDNEGCKISTSNALTYGTAFNSRGGGVYATEWTESAISVFFFPRGSIPSNVLSSNPDPSSWGTPLARFTGNCDIGSTFTDQQIVFDTTFCGDWAGQVWSGSTCAASTGWSNCEEFVANNPDAFVDAYWSVAGLKVYQTAAGSTAVQPSSASSIPATSSARQDSSAHAYASLFASSKLGSTSIYSSALPSTSLASSSIVEMWSIPE